MELKAKHLPSNTHRGKKQLASLRTFSSKLPRNLEHLLPEQTENLISYTSAESFWRGIGKQRPSKKNLSVVLRKRSASSSAAYANSMDTEQHKDQFMDSLGTSAATFVLSQSRNGIKQFMSLSVVQGSTAGKLGTTAFYQTTTMERDQL